MTDPRKAIFDAIRAGRDNRGFKDVEVKRIDDFLDSLGVARLNQSGTAPDTATFEHLLSVAAGRPVDDTMRNIAAGLTKYAASYGITQTKNRLAEFIAQTANETGGYRLFQENMRYSAKRIMQVWPNRFPTLASALPYAWDPSDPDREDIALANKTYGGRMGNEANGTDDNDGWDHRGGGLIQHTGAAEYAIIEQRLGLTPDQVRDGGENSVHAALDFWQRANVNEAVDRGDFREARRRTNGGYIGLQEVANIRSKVLGAM